MNQAALRFYEEAFAAQPTLVAAHRYNAACVAALAGCGNGKDAGQLDDKERVRLRRQALDWLCDELEARGRLLDRVSNNARSAADVARGLQHWFAAPDFVGVRGPEALAKLPPAEQGEWECLWTEVGEYSARAADAARDAARRNSPAVAKLLGKEPLPPIAAGPSRAGEALVGMWVNVDDKTHGLTRIEIAKTDKGWTIQAWALPAVGRSTKAR